MKRQWRLYHLILVSIVSYAFAALSLIYIQMYVAPPPGNQPIQWLISEPLPDRPLCPGETINYMTVVQVNEPGGLYIYTSVRRAVTHPDVVAKMDDPQVAAVLAEVGLPLAGDTIIPARADSIFRTGFSLVETPTVIVDAETTFVVPDLPPGPYQRMSVAGLDGRNSLSSVRVQEFRIGDDCR